MALDINSDMGESFGPWQIGQDADLFPLITSANVACGFHGGDPRVMERTVQALAERGVAVGAHPGFPDLVGFGRRAMELTPEEVRSDVLYQIGALLGFCQIARVRLHHVKPHGALYNMAAKDAGVAGAIVQAVRDLVPQALMYAQPGTALEREARSCGLQVGREVFADRAYMADGSLAPRSLPGAVLHDPEEIAARVVRMARGERIPTMDGGMITVEMDTVCIHSDTPTAVPIARALRAALEEAGMPVQSLT